MLMCINRLTSDPLQQKRCAAACNEVSFRTVSMMVALTAAIATGCGGDDGKVSCGDGFGIQCNSELEIFPGFAGVTTALGQIGIVTNPHLSDLNGFEGVGTVASTQVRLNASLCSRSSTPTLPGSPTIRWER